MRTEDKNASNTISSRFYIFRHNPANQVYDTVQYRTSSGEWSRNFDKANLWADHKFATKKASTLLKELKTTHSTWNVCIGKVVVEVDGMFMLELAC